VSRWLQPDLSGSRRLSPPDLQVARIAARGQNNLEVAAALFVCRRMVEVHLTSVCQSLSLGDVGISP
jgi:DNA-binding NarL/FixJ family response regulator